ncbi:phosphoenolpyruvate--protein phosphotransferase, partial [Fischerella thermalis CCMEE 5318]
MKESNPQLINGVPVIGIVIVSHSRRLAEGVRELALQMVQGHVPIAIAAGIDDPANPLGTDAMQVYEAIASVYSDDGVLVLMDLGSAFMSAEMALEFLPSEQQQHIYLCAAPLVEGAIAAVVAAASSSDIQRVITEAQGALVAKATQLGLDESHLSLVISEEPMINDKGHTSQIRLTVSNRFGLHARPAAQFVSCAARFQSQIQVRNITKGSEFVRADSINQVAMLGVRQGDEIVITATGSDAEEALAALQTLITSNFGEDNTPPHHPITPSPHLPIAPSPHLPTSLQGIPASPGIAI